MNWVKLNLFFLLALLHQASSCLPAESSGSFVWQGYGDYCYSTGDNIPYTWDEASEVCKNSGSLLASFHSWRELQVVKRKLNLNTDVFWTGLRAKGLYSSYEWIDGTPVDYAPWKPDSDDGTQLIDTCVFYNPLTGYFGKQSCNETHFYICKMADSSAEMPTITTAPSVTTSVPYAVCPEGWYRFGNKCYGLFGLSVLRKPWSKANEDCLAKGGSLVSIHSQEEQDFLYRTMSDKVPVAWIGFYELESTDDRAFHWSDGSPVDFMYWDAGEPNNWDNYKEQCVGMWFQSSRNGKWHDYRCECTSHAYICQVYAIPSPESLAEDDLCSEPEQWIKIGSSCYKIFDRNENSLSWAQAQSHCSTFGGNLATVRNMRDTIFLRSHLKELKDRFWIGLRNEGAHKRFYWLTGQVDYSNWDVRQPLELSGQASCVSAGSNGKWQVHKCGESLPFICEVTEGQPVVVLENSRMKTKCSNSSLHWKDYGGDFCYIIETWEHHTWNEAASKCIHEGGFLASFHSLEEVNIILKAVKTYGKALHIGLAQTHDGDYRWVDRTAVDFANWKPGQPNSNSHMCVEMLPDSGTWNDISCSTVRGYVCSTAKVSSEDSSKGRRTAAEDEPALGVQGIVIVILCCVVLVTTAVSIYFYVSRRRFGRISEPRAHFINT